MNPEWYEAMVNATLIFLKCLMRNLFLTSRVWRTWRRSGVPTVQVRLYYQVENNKRVSVTIGENKSTKNPKA
jgi:hypothetical protein